MENNANITMSRIAFERMQAKEEKEGLYRNIIIFILIGLLVISNLIWFVSWHQTNYICSKCIEAEEQVQTTLQP